MTYRVVFDNNDFVEAGTAPTKVNGTAATLSDANTFTASQTFNNQIINSKNLFVPCQLNCPSNYTSGGGIYYITQSDDYVIRVTDEDGLSDGIILYNKVVGDIVIVKNDSFKTNLGVFGGYPNAGGSINGSTGYPHIYINEINLKPNYATFLCVGTDTWVTI